MTISVLGGNPITDYLKRTQDQIATTTAQPWASTPPASSTPTDDATQRAIAASRAQAAASASGAAGVAGQQTESTQAGAMASASGAADAGASIPQYAPDGHVMTQAEITDRAAHQGMGAAAAAASTAAGVAGQTQQSTQAGAMANASSQADKTASAPPPPLPPPSAPQPPADPFHSTAGDNVKAYIDKKSATLGQDPGAISEAGQLYADRVTNGLKTPDASSVNAQNTEDTAASRRAYLARVQSEEAIGQSGFAPGTAQADRMRSTSQAGVDSANQAGQNSVNAYVRQRTEDNMNRAQGLEAQQYNRNQDNLQQAQGQDLQEYGRSEKATDRGLQAAATLYAHGRDTVSDQHWDTTNTQQQAQQGVDNAHWSTMNSQQQTQQGFENSQVIKGSDDTAKRNLLASLPDGPAKNKVMAGLQNGSLTLSNALDSVFGTDGAVKPEYRGQTPGQLGLAGETEYAQQTVDLQDPNLKNTNPQEYLKRVNAEILAKRNATNAPIQDATSQKDLVDASKRLAAGGQSPDDLAKLPAVSSQSIPSGDQVGAWLAKNDTGGWANIGGTPYKVTGGGNGFYGAYTVVKDQKGTVSYMDTSGRMHAALPPTSGSLTGISKGWQ